MVVAAGLVAGTAIVTNLPTPDDVTLRPYERHAVDGVVTIRTGEYQLVRVQGSTHGSSYPGESVGTQGLFLLITLRHRGLDSPSTFGQLTINDAAGRVFTTGGGVGGSNCSAAQPGIWEQCQALIEVSPQYLVGASAQCSAKLGSESWHDDVAVLELGVTATMISAWQTNHTPLRLGDATVGR